MKATMTDHEDAPTRDVEDSVSEDSNSEYSAEEESPKEEATAEQKIDGEFEDKAVYCLRYFVAFALVAAMAGAGIASWKLIRQNEHQDFLDELEAVSEAIAQQSESAVASIVGDCKSMASTMTALALSSSTMWPYFVSESFDTLGRNFRELSSASNVALAPIVTETNKTVWEKFALENQGWIEGGLKSEGVSYNRPLASVPEQIYQRTNGSMSKEVGHGPYAPMWLMSQAPTDPTLINFDTLSDETLGRVFQLLPSSNGPVLSDIVNPVTFFGIGSKSDVPSSLLVYPVHGGLDQNSTAVANLMAHFTWQSFFPPSNLLDVPPAAVVVDDNCLQSFTFLVGGASTEFVGYGDSHASKFDRYKREFPFGVSLTVDHKLSGDLCQWTVSVYPTEEFYDQFITKKPKQITSLVVGISIILSLIFCLYDCAVHSRQRRILALAARSEKIVSILYPKTIRDRLFRSPDDATEDGLEQSEPSQKTKRKARVRIDPAKAAKYQLRTFMNQDAEVANSSVDNLKEQFDDKPIADLFPSTTVMFADIAGFTAWSSVREPSQVFTLLETVYAAFDSIAKRRRIFKVETVGDCYVAVTGLPEPRKDHALAMARFAREAVDKFNDLVGQLETTLGPDTGDLGIRVGLHSGPVTAGVLRGDKSRFQLFGDTVNTAARIESTGKRNKIHVSQETAEFLKESGKANWVRRREQAVEAKGKGKLQTYWLLLKDDDSGALNGEDDSCSGENGNETGVQEKEQIAADQARRANLKKAMCADDVDLPPKIKRLVKWNVDVLTRLLKQIVAKRNAMGATRSFDMILTKAEGEIRKKFMVLDEVVEIIPLPGFDQRIYKRQQDPNSVELPQAVVDQMGLYVSLIAVMYRDNNFHNFEHASHVMMSVSKLLSRIIAADDLWNVHEDATKSKDFGWSVHDHTYGITSDPMTQFSVVLSALIHDVDHFGVSNSQLVKEDHKLARLFKAKSVAEQNSIVLAWDTLMDPRFHDLRRTIYSDPFELERFRQLIANTVLATDIFDKQLQALRKKRWEVAFSMRSEEGFSTKDDINRKATIVIEHLIQASDVAHTMQHWHIYRKWNERLFAEMAAAYSAGRMEKNPAEFWYAGELGFFDNYIIPLAKKLKDCGVFGVSSDEYLNYALENRREWSNNGEEVVRTLIEKYQSSGVEQAAESAPA